MFLGGMAVTFCIIGCVIYALLKRRLFNFGVGGDAKNFEETIETKVSPTPKQGPTDCFCLITQSFLFKFMSVV